MDYSSCLNFRKLTALTSEYSCLAWTTRDSPHKLAAEKKKQKQRRWVRLSDWLFIIHLVDPSHLQESCNQPRKLRQTKDSLRTEEGIRHQSTSPYAVCSRYFSNTNSFQGLFRRRGNKARRTLGTRLFYNTFTLVNVSELQFQSLAFSFRAQLKPQLDNPTHRHFGLPFQFHACPERTHLTQCVTILYNFPLWSHQ